ncbi:MAG: TetR/AcrR family transcriptional regulator [Candidatus Marinimicrobia bacterium]|nr:TetR/AcrR family transcriptional regulator [Candidatus Neomarinimicrobiota bacterium]
MDTKSESRLIPAIKYARQFILANGTRGLNIDPMAADLHIAKKTIYKVFPTKEQFIEYVLLDIYHELFTETRAIQLNDNEPLKCFYGITKIMFKHISQINPQTILDVKLFYPKVWREVEEFEHEVINRILDSFQKADNLGLLRKKFDLKFTADLIVRIVQNTFQPEIFISAPYSITEMIKIFVDIIMNGLMEKQFTFNFSDDE